MNLRELIDENLGPSLDGLREAGVRELQIDPDSNAVALRGEGFTLLVHGDEEPGPLLLAQGSRVPEPEAGAESPHATPPAPEPVTKPKPVAVEPAASRSGSEVAANGVDYSVMRCGDEFARHKWGAPDGGKQQCTRCGAERPKWTSSPAPRTSKAQAELFRRKGMAPEPAAPGRVERNDLQPRDLAPNTCPRCAKTLQTEDTPHGSRKVCERPPRGCAWMEWTLRTAAA